MILSGDWMGFECRRLNQVDESERGGLHYYLGDNDECYYIGEYTTGAGYNEPSGINQAVFNLKKKPSIRESNPAAYQYKGEAIRLIARCMAKLLKPEVIQNTITLVPIPPSKVMSDPDYDDRMLQICNQMTEIAGGGDVAELLVQKSSTHATHEDIHKPTPDMLIDNYEVVVPQSYIPRQYIILVDDVLTTGSHYVACRRLLSMHFPSAFIYGLFFARRVFSGDAF